MVEKVLALADDDSPMLTNGEEAEATLGPSHALQHLIVADSQLGRRRIH